MLSPRRDVARFLTALLTLLGFAGLLAAITWPVAAHWTTDFLGSPGSDAYQYVWNTWHFRYALLHGQNPMTTSFQLYPDEVSLWLHAYTPIIGLLHVVLPGGPAVAINVALAGHFGLAGAGATWLGRRFGLRWGAALAVGVWYAFTAFKTVRLADHTNLLLTGLVPLYVGCFLLAFAFKPGRWWPHVRSRWAMGGCALLGLLTLLGDYPTTFWLLYYSAGVWLFFALRLGKIDWQKWRPWVWLAAGLVVCHFLIRALQHAKIPDGGAFWWGGDLVAYLVPPPHLWWPGRELSAAAYANPKFFNMPSSVENVTFLGYLIPLVALGLLVLRRRDQPRASLGAAADAWNWAVPALWFVTAAFLLITLPEGRIFGHRTLRPPTALLHFVPFLNNLRCPTRAVLLPALLLPLLTLRALARRSVVGQSPMVGWICLAVALLEVWPRPYPHTRLTDASAANVAVATLSAPGAVLAVPLGIRDGMRELGRFQMVDLLDQTYHHRPILGGYLSRLPPAQFAAFAADTVVARLLSLQADSTATIRPPTPVQVATFHRRYAPAALLLRLGYQSAAIQRLMKAVTAGRGFREKRLSDGTLLYYRPTKVESGADRRASSRN